MGDWEDHVNLDSVVIWKYVLDRCLAGRSNHNPVLASWQRQPGFHLKIIIPVFYSLKSPSLVILKVRLKVHDDM